MPDDNAPVTRRDLQKARKQSFTATAVLAALTAILGYLGKDCLQESKGQIDRELAAKKGELDEHFEKMREQLGSYQLVKELLPQVFSEDRKLAAAAGQLLVRCLKGKDDELGAAILALAQEQVVAPLKEAAKSDDIEQLSRDIRAIDESGATDFAPAVDRVKKDYPHQMAQVKKLDDAKELEKKGYELVLREEYADAAAQFEKADTTYPTIHAAKELAKYLHSVPGLVPDGGVGPDGGRVAAEVLRKYSVGMPPDIREQFRQKAQTAR